MQTLAKKILEQILQNGLAFTLLAMFSFLFYTQNESLHEKIDMCNKEVIEVYRQQNEKLIEVLNRNSDAWEKLSESINDR